MCEAGLGLYSTRRPSRGQARAMETSPSFRLLRRLFRRRAMRSTLQPGDVRSQPVVRQDIDQSDGVARSRFSSSSGTVSRRSGSRTALTPPEWDRSSRLVGSTLLACERPLVYVVDLVAFGEDSHRNGVVAQDQSVCEGFRLTDSIALGREVFQKAQVFRLFVRVRARRVFSVAEHASGPVLAFARPVGEDVEVDLRVRELHHGTS